MAMASLAPRLHAGMEVAQQLFGALDRSVREMRARRACSREPAFTVDRVVLKPVSTSTLAHSDRVVIHRLQPSTAGFSAAHPDILEGREPPSMVPSRGVLGPTYPYWVNDGQDYCA